MVYVARDGTVYEHPPWSLERLVSLFWGVCHFIYVFFLTMFNIDPDNPRGGFSRSSWGGGSGGGGGGGNPPRPPNRRMGTFRTISDCSVPGGG
uniref:Putative selenoprotein g n=1 Tax=Phlebotomus kandelakii TaxID=1109342 RepID=A0A6B2EJF0_9DIPT